VKNPSINIFVLSIAHCKINQNSVGLIGSASCSSSCPSNLALAVFFLEKTQETPSFHCSMNKAKVLWPA